MKKELREWFWAIVDEGAPEESLVEWAIEFLEWVSKGNLNEFVRAKQNRPPQDFAD